MRLANPKINEKVLAYMLHYDINIIAARQSLIDNEHTYVTSTYYLLLDKYLKKKNVLNIYDISNMDLYQINASDKRLKEQAKAKAITEGPDHEGFGMCPTNQISSGKGNRYSELKDTAADRNEIKHQYADAD